MWGGWGEGEVWEVWGEGEVWEFLRSLLPTSPPFLLPTPYSLLPTL
ncbi:MULTISPECIES: hypothetical protein [unclassified Moorena]|nr:MULTISPECIES: hypothetical protein [unclassified Moorena]NEO14537.1 hypothetical protein [Moorena sp. SIO3E8]NEQ01868.1 hypothetical protein [Moorena sp. SIO3F7]NEQ62480.1 hypothetical protein [Moorena sp. SIO4A1]